MDWGDREEDDNSSRGRGPQWRAVGGGSEFGGSSAAGRQQAVGHSGRRAQGKAAKQRRRSAVKIQAATRGKDARKEAAAREEAAAKLQSARRGQLSRRRVKDLKAEHMAAIQALEAKRQLGKAREPGPWQLSAPPLPGSSVSHGVTPHKLVGTSPPASGQAGASSPRSALLATPSQANSEFSVWLPLWPPGIAVSPFSSEEQEAATSFPMRTSPSRQRAVAPLARYDGMTSPLGGHAGGYSDTGHYDGTVGGAWGYHDGSGGRRASTSHAVLQRGRHPSPRDPIPRDRHHPSEHHPHPHAHSRGSTAITSLRTLIGGSA